MSRSRQAYKVLFFASKHDGLSSEQFRQQYEAGLVPFVLEQAPSPLVYKRYYLNPKQPIIARSKASIDFDVVSELGFEDQAAFQEWISFFHGNEEMKAMQSKFFKPETVRIFEVDERVTSDIKSAEIATKGYDRPFKVFVFVRKKSGMSLEVYQNFYETQQVPTLLKCWTTTPLVWKRLYIDSSANLRKDAEGSVSFDSVAMLTFGNESEFQQQSLGKHFEPETARLITAGEDQFMDKDFKLLVAVEEYVTSDA